MTEISYVVTDSNGQEEVVKSMPEAQRIVQERGGSYKQVFTETISLCEAHCRKDARQGGKQS